MPAIHTKGGTHTFTIPPTQEERVLVEGRSPEGRKASQPQHTSRAEQSRVGAAARGGPRIPLLDLRASCMGIVCACLMSVFLRWLPHQIFCVTQIIHHSRNEPMCPGAAAVAFGICLGWGVPVRVCMHASPCSMHAAF